MTTSRHLGRVVVLQTLFAIEFHGGDPHTMLQYVADGTEQPIEDLSFATALLDGVLKHKSQIADMIVKYAPQWPLDKIAPIDRAALEIGLYELCFADDIPDIVAINEAIELAKNFGNESAGKFVNGVLNSVLHERQKENKKNRSF